ncbi:ovarian cancer G-protein coupled receptor 1 [Aplysia californica]|uniref:Ovarian cancer G-protein coupled receptor 1 n=1 Tax=Aplysia californica TaxID=6500 RepID=A0ABM1VXP8_APLCA|nr:ovarian cancer G-protein coupled receptor 1 [Aplysia californica]XP_035827178.1 ovarian cancer G-protein coupled receptor 1 [Aplysia californica]XP_035827182.1 ovarian cancer G-protein coupled receptor 1 [Aplysia californica]XP_035827183.1 ovarian cancer G-protein coupled receptor 1 [Aplysia californica]XP_035827187.1 ovarian cancer G-protein coupled receptor 1 [Aplysia californica]XP_035827190.1 ovarian cancer G-protein coupled receptor 1 [Aplysia californica]XP_035827191.1 ovarian cancer
MDNSSAHPNGTVVFLDIFEVYSNHSASGTIDRVVTPIFYVIGLPANPLSAYIWLNRKTRANNSSAIYLGALSISHVVFLLLHILQELRYAWNISTYEGYVSCEIFNMVFCIPQYLAPLLVLGFTVERYIAICHPFAKERYCTVRRAVVVVISLLVFCIIISTFQAYFWTYDAQVQLCNHRKELHEGNFVELWTWFTELLLFGVAPLAALVFNVLVIREIRNLTSGGPAHTGAGGGGSQASTVTLLSVSFYLICTWLPYTIVYSMSKQFPIGDLTLKPEDIEHDPTWQRHLLYQTIRCIMTEITLSNSACYFFIYYTTGKHFRQRVHELLCPKRCLKTESRNHGAKQYMAVSKSGNYNGTLSTCV